MWDVSAPKGLCCFWWGVRSLSFSSGEKGRLAASPGVLGCGLCCFDVSAFFGNNKWCSPGLFFPALNTGRYRQLFSCRSCWFSPFPYAGKKGIRRMAGVTKLRVIFWQCEITCSYRQSLWPLSFASKCKFMPADEQGGLDRMSFLLLIMILDNSCLQTVRFQLGAWHTSAFGFPCLT